MQEEERPSVEEIKNFYDNLVKLNNKDSITIKGYAQKSEGDSTSKVRRLSLKRALFLRSLLLKENFNITQIYVKALGYDNELEGNKDIVIITNN
jgi:outer membrane protein OmpA-like peptidoglycan-associated protein